MGGANIPTAQRLLDMGDVAACARRLRRNLNITVKESRRCQDRGLRDLEGLRRISARTQISVSDA